MMIVRWKGACLFCHPCVYYTQSDTLMGIIGQPLLNQAHLVGRRFGGEVSVEDQRIGRR
jgi:hypothetical protein